MLQTERRMRRADNRAEALLYQVDACRNDSGIDAMIIADSDGFPLAISGDALECDEVAAHMAVIAERASEWSGLLLGDDVHRSVQMTKVMLGQRELLVVAVGGKHEQRRRQVARCAAGALRILTA